jgi:hypothetical protein
MAGLKYSIAFLKTFQVPRDKLFEKPCLKASLFIRNQIFLKIFLAFSKTFSITKNPVQTFSIPYPKIENIFKDH